MKKIVSIGALLLFGVIITTNAQTVPIPKVGWDYQDADITTYNVTRFEIQYDTAGWTSVGIPVDTQVIAGGKTYWIPLIVGTGLHNFSVRACNGGLCSDALGPLPFIKPGPASNLRISTR